MQELSLNILDVAENSVSAGASLIEITVELDRRGDRLTIAIGDNGCGMDEETKKRVADPFYTTRTTRKVGLGVPLFKMAAEMTGGGLTIRSEKGKGTQVTATFGLSHIDRMLLGDMAGTMSALIGSNPDRDFRFLYRVDGRSFEADTRTFREILGGISLGEAEVVTFIRGYIADGIAQCDCESPENERTVSQGND